MMMLLFIIMMVMISGPSCFRIEFHPLFDRGMEVKYSRPPSQEKYKVMFQR